LCYLLHSLFHISFAVLSPHDRIQDIFLELQEKGVIPQLLKATYKLYFAQNGSTLFLKVPVLGGTSETGSEKQAGDLSSSSSLPFCFQSGADTAQTAMVTNNAFV
jgi:hypothetical protein